MKNRYMYAILFMFCFGCYNQSNSKYYVKNKVCISTDTLKNDSSAYTQKIEKIIDKQIHKHAISDEELLEIIPVQQNDFLYYLSFEDENNEQKRDAWLDIDDSIYNRAENNSTVFLKLLQMSEFVDGYYAENYFENIEFLISKKQKDVFCKNYHSFSNNYRWRLEDLHAKYCKK
jgi:hypothetical protein